ncbi:MAG TPA: DUF2459 domain-containing protein [Chthoniobacteraceae bacterium]
MLLLRPFFLCTTALLLTEFFSERAAAEPVWVVSNGFHTSLGFRARDVPQLAVLTPDRHADYVLIGWGDADFYRYPATAWLLIKAVCWPTPGALHVVPVRGPLTGTLRNSDIIRLDVTPAGFAKMRGRLVKHLAMDERNAAVSLGNGYVETSRFYLSRESFYFPKMCNMWVAQTLRIGGVRVIPGMAISAQCLQWQIGPQGRRLNTRRRPLDAF